MARVFLTGATGLLGRSLLPRFLQAGHRVRALARTPGATPDAEWIVGDLRNPSGYAAHLIDTDILVHAAAVTGKATPALHDQVNREGTATLVEAATRAGVARIIFISSIAAGFRDIKRYPYALAKRAAEQCVRRSPISATILRPTIIIGPGAGVLEGLRRLAALPVIPVFGPGRVLVQPIGVDDTARYVTHAVTAPDLDGLTCTIGGPDRVTLEDLLGRIHRRLRPSPPRFVHLPLGPILTALGTVERIAYRAVPLTVGQLATFRHDGIADPNPLQDALAGSLTSLDELLKESLAP